MVLHTLHCPGPLCATRSSVAQTLVSAGVGNSSVKFTTTFSSQSSVLTFRSKSIDHKCKMTLVSIQISPRKPLHSLPEVLYNLDDSVLL